jgi:GNAT superfamily N-acetyltransferase
MSTYKFSLREIQPSDSRGIGRLVSEFGGDLTTRFLVDPYTAIVYGTEFRTTGVVVEAAGHDGYVGMGTVRFSTVQYNEDILPLAFLDGLKVHQDFRGNGLGHKIAGWRIQRAREEFGDECVIGTGMLHDNHASHAVAARWCHEFAEAAIEVRIVPTRTRPPSPVAGITVREIEPREYEQFAQKQNAFYRQYNMYPRSSAETIDNALCVGVEGKRPYRYFAAVDARGNLLAGAQAWARGLLKSDTVNHLPSAMRLMNKLLHVLPPDYTIRDVSVSGLWYEASQMKTAQYLWEMMRWLCRDQGTNLAAGFDARDPSIEILSLKPWNQPRPKITLAIHAPAPLNRERLLFVSGRV